jgi:hypothetical protein
MRCSRSCASHRRGLFQSQLDWPNVSWHNFCFPFLDWQLFFFLRAVGSSKEQELGGSPAKPSNRFRWCTDCKLNTDWFIDLTGTSSSVRARGAHSLAILVCWSIWPQRNARVFDGQGKIMSCLVSEIKDAARLWVLVGAKHLSSLVVSPDYSM